MSGPYEGHPLSYGAGVNSTALAVLLVREGWHGPIVFSDTGADWPETMAYLDTFRTWLAPYGLELTVLGGDWRSGKDRLTLIEYCEHYRLTPYPKVRWCTYRWKTLPLEKWCVANGFTLEDMLLGISADEAHRQPERIRPLVERGIDRRQCTQIILEAGLPVPRKSGCWLCPFQKLSQWRELYIRHPDLFERAARLEEASTARTGGGVITHTRISGDASLRQLEAGFRAQTEMFSVLDY
jgi:hypothetical protein